MMRAIFKTVISFFLVPATRWFLRKEREFSYRDITVRIPPGVFHPGLFHSTTLLVDYLSTKSLNHRSFLELGSGSGLISIYAAKAGARVTALDLSQQAVGSTKMNALANEVHLDVIHSDLFDNLNQTSFDWIVINPPYYPQTPKSENDMAWYCGEDFGYFKKLFDSLGNHMQPSTEVIMAFTTTKHLETVLQIGMARQFHFKEILRKKSFLDGFDLLYRISKADPIIHPAT